VPQSLSSVCFHGVFSTKSRHPFLADEGLRAEVHSYLGGISKRLGCDPIVVGGVADHVHLLVRFGKTITIADWIKEIKRGSSVFAKSQAESFFWQAGYGVFGVEHQHLAQVERYILNQGEHHRTVSFQDEFRALMVEHSVEWDEKYVWD